MSSYRRDQEERVRTLLAVLLDIPADSKIISEFMSELGKWIDSRAQEAQEAF
jgi:hypothetical protein